MTARERAADIFSQRWSSHNLSALVEAAILAAEVAAAEEMRGAAVAAIKAAAESQPEGFGFRVAAIRALEVVAALPLPGGS